MKLIKKNFKKLYEATELKPFIIPPGFVLVADTREQKPLFTRPPKGLMVFTSTLTNGDYSIQGFEDKFCIERKQLSDFYSYIGKERKRTARKMKRLAEYRFAGLVIESTEADILSGYMMSRVPPEVARQALVSFEVRYGLHVYYSASRDDIARWILDRAIKFYKVFREVTKVT